MIPILKREPVLICLLLLMLVGCLWSRAVLSVSMILFVVVACFTPNILSQTKKTFTNPHTISVVVLFFIPLLSGLWSSDLSTWKQVMQDKLPFLFLPIAFSGNWKINNRQWKLFLWIVLSLLVASTFWSTGQYLISKNTIDESYLQSKTMPVPVFGDHIRFSWLVCAGFITSIYFMEQTDELKQKITCFAFALWFFAFLHLLAARTGLTGSYIFILFWCINFLIKNKKKTINYIVLLSSALMIVVAWLFFPTLQNRIRYMKYNLSFIVKDEYLPHSNDGNRMISLKAGWTILKEHPFGVGAGDIKNVVSKWHDNHIEDSTEDDKIFPANEWLIHGGMAGWPGVLVFTIAFFIPLFYRVKKYWIFILGLQTASFIACFFDSSLEVQAGIFIYCFMTLLWWKRLADTI